MTAGSSMITSVKAWRCSSGLDASHSKGYQRINASTNQTPPYPRNRRATKSTTNIDQQKTHVNSTDKVVSACWPSNIIMRRVASNSAATCLEDIYIYIYINK